jgi:4-amino-4-deoxy-L-arabinose transferase-like glycosyltransferase
MSYFNLIWQKLQSIYGSEIFRKYFWVSLILFSGFLLRYLFVFYFHPPEKYIFSDMEGYFNRAYHLHLGKAENIYDTFYPPGTHIVYSIFFETRNFFVSVKWFNILISCFTCLIIFFITDKLFGSRAGKIALILSSFNYLFIDFTGYLLSETLFTFSLALVFWFFIKSILCGSLWEKRIYAVLAGFSIIAGASVKSSIMLFLPMFGFWWLFNHKKYRILYNLPFYALGFLPLFILLIIRFTALTGHFGIISSNGGFNFFQGRSHIKDATCIDQQRGTNYLFASPVAVQKNYSYNETFYTGPYDSDFFYKTGLEEIKHDPGRAAIYSLQHIADLFITADIWPSSAIIIPFPFLIHIFNILTFIFIIIPGLLAGIFRFKQLRSGVGVLIFFLIAVIILTSFVYYGDPRFRVPFDVFFIILASLLYSHPALVHRRM